VEYTNTLFFQPTWDKKIIEEFKELLNLTVFRMRIPILDKGTVSIASIIQILPNLEMLDLSYTRGLTNQNINDIFGKLNNSRIVYLCMRKFQLSGGDGFLQSINQFSSKQNLNLSHILEIDLSENGLTNFPPGITNVAPNLQILDVSYNNILSMNNMAIFLELLLHPSIIWLICSYQGYELHNRYPEALNPMLYSGNAEYGNNETVFIIQTINEVSLGNISNITNSSEHTCNIVKLLIPNFFQEYNCSELKFFPEIRNIAKDGIIKFPVGENLLKVHFEQSIFPTIILNKGLFTIEPNNSLTELIFSNNIEWITTTTSKQLLTEIKGFSNFDNMKYVDLSGNGLKINISQFTEGHFRNLKN
jgi:Leucine-rich repeat (LRR) protein